MESASFFHTLLSGLVPTAARPALATKPEIEHVNCAAVIMQGEQLRNGA